MEARRYGPHPRTGTRRKKEKVLGPLDRSLTEFFEADVCRQVLRAKGAAPRNVQQYRESLMLWDLINGRPPLWKIIDCGRELAAEFLNGLRSRTWRDRPLSNNTIRKHCIHVQAVLDVAGPPSRRNPMGAGLIDPPPVLHLPRVEVKEVEDAYTLEEIAAQIDAAACVPRSWYWRNVILFAYNSAFRRQTLFAFDRHWLKRDELGWWADVPAAALKRGRGRRFYLNAAAMAALRPLMATNRDRPLSNPVERSWFYKTLKVLQECAGLPPERRFGLHAFRKACATELVQINPMAASWHLGHRTPHVTRDHYTHPRAFVAALERLPQPPVSDALDRQLRLFQ